MRLSGPLLLALALLLGGCAHADRSRYQGVQVPSKFVHARQSADSGQATYPASGPWWQALGDETLADLIQHGLENNPRIIEAKLTYQQAQIARRGARALVPVSGVTTSDHRTAGTAGTVPRPTTYTTGARQTGSILLDFAGEARNERKALDADIHRTYALYLRERRVQTTAIAAAYVRALQEARAVRLLRKATSSRRKTVSAAILKEKAGTGTRLDIVRARALVADARSAEAVRKTREERALGRLVRLTGVPLAEIRARLERDRLETITPQRAIATLPADIIRRRADVRAAEHALQAATARIGVARAALYPSIRLDGSITLSATDVATNRSWFFGPTLNLPILNRRQLKADVALARSRAERAYERWRTAVRNAVQDVEDALADFANGSLSRDALATSSRQNRLALSLARKGLKGGVISVDTVLDLERRSTIAALALSEAEASLLESHIRLIASLGGEAVDVDYVASVKLAPARSEPARPGARKAAPGKRKRRVAKRTPTLRLKSL